MLGWLGFERYETHHGVLVSSMNVERGLVYQILRGLEGDNLLKYMVHRVFLLELEHTQSAKERVQGNLLLKQYVIGG